VAGTSTTGLDGSVGGVTVGRVTVRGVVVNGSVGGTVVVDAACGPPPDPLHAPPATTANANSRRTARGGFVDRAIMKPLNLPPRGTPIVRLLRL
jgi:hypothetical protein